MCLNTIYGFVEAGEIMHMYLHQGFAHTIHILLTWSKAQENNFYV